MKTKKDELIISILIPLAVGAVSAYLSSDVMTMFQNMRQPPLSPPGWLFPVVWTILYTLMGISSYIIYRQEAEPTVKKRALWIYAAQLIVNFFWSIFFFRLEWYWFSFFWLILLWILILAMILQFQKINKTAAYLQIPYLIWVTFAGYLNLSAALLN